MDTLKLEVNYRTDMSQGRRKMLRRKGWATGTVCGRGVESISIEVNMSDVEREIKGSDTGLKSLFKLKVNGAPTDSDGLVIIKTLERDAITRRPLDVQFQRVSMVDKIHVSVPIEVVGKPTAILREGGMIEQTLDMLEILCLASDIPTVIQADVSELTIGEHIRVADLKLPEHVEAVADPDVTVVISRVPNVRREATEEAAE